MARTTPEKADILTPETAMSFPFRALAISPPDLLKNARPLAAFRQWQVEALARGADALMLRTHGVDRSLVQTLLQTLDDRYPREDRPFRLILNHYEVAQALLSGDLSLTFPLNTLDGFHLTRHHALPRKGYLHEAWGLRPLLGRSCHSLEEVVALKEQNGDYALLSPIFPTQTHPDAAPLWPEGLEAIAGQVEIPIIALGGITEANEVFARDAGAVAVAGISRFL